MGRPARRSREGAQWAGRDAAQRATPCRRGECNHLDESEWLNEWAGGQSEEAQAGDGRARATSGERHSLHFDDLMNWNGQAVQDRFSGAVQYLRSAKKHGLLDFNGEMPQGALIESRCMRWSRRALLDFAMAQLHLVVPTLPQRTGSAGSSESPADTLRRRILIEFAQQLDEFTNSSFDLDVVAPRPIDRNAGGITA